MLFTSKGLGNRANQGPIVVEEERPNFFLSSRGKAYGRKGKHKRTMMRSMLLFFVATCVHCGTDLLYISYFLTYGCNKAWFVYS